MSLQFGQLPYPLRVQSTEHGRYPGKGARLSFQEKSQSNRYVQDQCHRHGHRKEVASHAQKQQPTPPVSSQEELNPSTRKPSFTFAQIKARREQRPHTSSTSSVEAHPRSLHGARNHFPSSFPSPYMNGRHNNSVNDSIVCDVSPRRPALLAIKHQHRLMLKLKRRGQQLQRNNHRFDGEPYTHRDSGNHRRNHLRSERRALTARYSSRINSHCEYSHHDEQIYHDNYHSHGGDKHVNQDSMKGPQSSQADSVEWHSSRAKMYADAKFLTARGFSVRPPNNMHLTNISNHNIQPPQHLLKNMPRNYFVDYTLGKRLERLERDNTTRNSPCFSPSSSLAASSPFASSFRVSSYQTPSPSSCISSTSLPVSSSSSLPTTPYNHCSAQPRQQHMHSLGPFPPSPREPVSPPSPSSSSSICRPHTSGMIGITRSNDKGGVEKCSVDAGAGMGTVNGSVDVSADNDTDSNTITDDTPRDGVDDHGEGNNAAKVNKALENAYSVDFDGITGASINSRSISQQRCDNNSSENSHVNSVNDGTDHDRIDSNNGNSSVSHTSGGKAWAEIQWFDMNEREFAFYLRHLSQTDHQQLQKVMAQVGRIQKRTHDLSRLAQPYSEYITADHGAHGKEGASRHIGTENDIGKNGNNDRGDGNGDCSDSTENTVGVSSCNAAAVFKGGERVHSDSNDGPFSPINHNPTNSSVDGCVDGTSDDPSTDTGTNLHESGNNSNNTHDSNRNNITNVITDTPIIRANNTKIDSTPGVRDIIKSVTNMRVQINATVTPSMISTDEPNSSGSDFNISDGANNTENKTQVKHATKPACVNTANSPVSMKVVKGSIRNMFNTIARSDIGKNPSGHINNQRSISDAKNRTKKNSKTNHTQQRYKNAVARRQGGEVSSPAPTLKAYFASNFKSGSISGGKDRAFNCNGSKPYTDSGETGKDGTSTENRNVIKSHVKNSETKTTTTNIELATMKNGKKNHRTWTASNDEHGNDLLPSSEKSATTFVRNTNDIINSVDIDTRTHTDEGGNTSTEQKSVAQLENNITPTEASQGPREVDDSQEKENIGNDDEDDHHENRENNDNSEHKRVSGSSGKPETRKAEMVDLSSTLQAGLEKQTGEMENTEELSIEMKTHSNKILSNVDIPFDDVADNANNNQNSNEFDSDNDNTENKAEEIHIGEKGDEGEGRDGGKREEEEREGNNTRNRTFSEKGGMSFRPHHNRTESFVSRDIALALMESTPFAAQALSTCLEYAEESSLTSNQGRAFDRAEKVMEKTNTNTKQKKKHSRSQSNIGVESRTEIRPGKANYRRTHSVGDGGSSHKLSGGHDNDSGKSSNRSHKDNDGVARNPTGVHDLERDVASPVATKGERIGGTKSGFRISLNNSTGSKKPSGGSRRRRTVSTDDIDGSADASLLLNRPKRNGRAARRSLNLEDMRRRKGKTENSARLSLSPDMLGGKDDRRRNYLLNGRRHSTSRRNSTSSNAAENAHNAGVQTDGRLTPFERRRSSSRRKSVGNAAVLDRYSSNSSFLRTSSARKRKSYSKKTASRDNNDDGRAPDNHAEGSAVVDGRERSNKSSSHGAIDGSRRRRRRSSVSDLMHVRKHSSSNGVHDGSGGNVSDRKNSRLSIQRQMRRRSVGSVCTMRVDMAARTHKQREEGDKDERSSYMRPTSTSRSKRRASARNKQNKNSSGNSLNPNTSNSDETNGSGSGEGTKTKTINADGSTTDSHHVGRSSIETGNDGKGVVEFSVAITMPAPAEAADTEAAALLTPQHIGNAVSDARLSTGRTLTQETRDSNLSSPDGAKAGVRQNLTENTTEIEHSDSHVTLSTRDKGKNKDKDSPGDDGSAVYSTSAGDATGIDGKEGGNVGMLNNRETSDDYDGNDEDINEHNDRMTTTARSDTEYDTVYKIESDDDNGGSENERTIDTVNDRSDVSRGTGNDTNAKVKSSGRGSHKTDSHASENGDENQSLSQFEQHLNVGNTGNDRKDSGIVDGAVVKTFTGGNKVEHPKEDDGKHTASVEATSDHNQVGTQDGRDNDTDDNDNDNDNDTDDNNYSNDESNNSEGDDANSKWAAFFDDTYNTYYYHNSRTGVTQWEKPGGFVAE